MQIKLGFLPSPVHAPFGSRAVSAKSLAEKKKLFIPGDGKTHRKDRPGEEGRATVLKNHEHLPS